MDLEYLTNVVLLQRKKEIEEGMKKPTEITKYYTDRFAGFFLTSKT